MILEKKRINKKIDMRLTGVGKTDKNFRKKELTRSQLLIKKKTLRIGEICNLKITALAPKNIGIDEYSFSYAVFVPNAKIGTQIKAKIIKIQESSYAVAQIIEEKNVDSTITDLLNKIPVKPGDVLTVSITKQMEKGNAGIVELANNYRLIIPLSNVKLIEKNSFYKESILENVKVTVTRVKLKYGFAKIEKLSKDSIVANLDSKEQKTLSNMFINKIENGLNQSTKKNFQVGCKFTTTLPLTYFNKLAFSPSSLSSGVRGIRVRGRQTSLLRKQKLTAQSISEKTKQNNTHNIVSSLPSLETSSVNSNSNNVSFSSNRKGSEEYKIKDKSKFIVLNVNGSIVFLKFKNSFANLRAPFSLGRQGEGGIRRILSEKLALLEQNENKNIKLRVRIKITAKSTNCAVGKILQINLFSAMAGLEPSAKLAKQSPAFGLEGEKPLGATKGGTALQVVEGIPSSVFGRGLGKRGSEGNKGGHLTPLSQAGSASYLRKQGRNLSIFSPSGFFSSSIRAQDRARARTLRDKGLELLPGLLSGSEPEGRNKALPSRFHAGSPEGGTSSSQGPLSPPSGGRTGGGAQPDLNPKQGSIRGSGSKKSISPNFTDVKQSSVKVGNSLSQVNSFEAKPSTLLNSTKNRGIVALNSFNSVGSLSTSTTLTKQLTAMEYEKKKKTALVLNSIREMIHHGMHFGEKAVKCNARMQNYIWTVRSRSNVNFSTQVKQENSLIAPYSFGNGPTKKIWQNQNLSFQKKEDAKAVQPNISSNLLSLDLNSFSENKKQLAKMSSRSLLKERKLEQEKTFIKKGRHVINLLKTRRCLNQALNKVTKYALKGRTFLFIGTKKPAAGLVARASFFTKNSFYVNTRWLGGMLTNWKTICKSISKIRPILKEKQKVVRNILERRQAIKNRLIKKAFLLKKKSKLILNKGRLLLETLKKEKTICLQNAKKLTTLRNELLYKGMQYIEKRKKLIQKRRELTHQTLLLKERGLDLSLKHKAILNQLAIYSKKLREYKYLLILTSEIKNLKAATVNSSQSLLSVSYGKLKEIHKLEDARSLRPVASFGAEQGVPQGGEAFKNWILPNPPKEILNRIVLTYLQQDFLSSPKEGAQFRNQVGQTAEGENQGENLLYSNSLITGKSTNSISNVGSLGKESNKKHFIVCSTLLSKFSGFSSYIKSVIRTLITSIQSLEAQANTYSIQLNEIKNTLKIYLSFKQKYVAELQLLKVKFTKERSIIRIIKRKFKALDAQKKLLRFLPRLRYLPTPQTKISEIVKILLARIVDPKLKYPIENIYDQKLSTSSKKLAAARKKKWQRLEKYFGGIANMTKITKTQISRNVAIIIGQKEEMNAVYECQKLGIKMFTIVDTNCNPTLSDHIIPANDDSRSSIKYILTKLITRIRLAQKLRSRLLAFGFAK